MIPMTTSNSTSVKAEREGRRMGLAPLRSPSFNRLQSIIAARYQRAAAITRNSFRNSPSTDLGQRQGISELQNQRLPKGAVNILGHLRVLGKQRQCVFPGLLKQLHLAGHVGQLELRQAVLPDA